MERLYNPFMDSSDKEGIEEKYLFKSKEELIKSL